MISHELRNPLHILMGYNNLLLEEESGNLSAEQLTILQHMERNMERSISALAELVHATLDASRLESGRTPLELAHVSVSQLLKAVEAETEGLRTKTPLTFHWEIEPGLPSLHTDAVKLKVILKNLIGNAVKFTHAGSITIGARAQADGVELSVADTGIGIAPEDLPVIFEPFRQLSGVLPRMQRGVGLGLYITRRLVELLGGTIGVESEVGHGSTFRLWIPQATTGKAPLSPASLH